MRKKVVSFRKSLRTQSNQYIKKVSPSFSWCFFKLQPPTTFLLLFLTKKIYGSTFKIVVKGFMCKCTKNERKRHWLSDITRAFNFASTPHPSFKFEFWTSQILAIQMVVYLLWIKTLLLLFQIFSLSPFSFLLARMKRIRKFEFMYECRRFFYYTQIPCILWNPLESLSSLENWFCYFSQCVMLFTLMLKDFKLEIP